MSWLRGLNERLSAPEGPEAKHRPIPTPEGVPDDEVDHAAGGDAGARLTEPTPPKATQTAMPIKGNRVVVVGQDGGSVEAGVGEVDGPGVYDPLAITNDEEFEESERDHGRPTGINPPVPGEKVYL